MKKVFMLVMVLCLAIGGITQAALEDGLLGYWPLDGDGTDASINGRDGSVLSGSNWVPGVLGDCLECDGTQPTSGGVVEGTAVEWSNGLDGITISVWVKSDVIDTDKGFIIFETPRGNDDREIRYDRSGANGDPDPPNVLKIGLQVTDDATNSGILQMETAANTQTTDWQHVVITWKSGEALTCYLDGALHTPDNNRGPKGGVTRNNTLFIIGRGGKDRGDNNDGGGKGTMYGWDGLIDEVAVWNRALSADEVANVYNGGQPKAISNPASHAVLVAPAPDGVSGVAQAGVVLQWDPAAEDPGFTSYEVFLTANPAVITDPNRKGDALIASVPVADPGQADLDALSVGPLAAATTYLWQIEGKMPDGNNIAGPIWSFTTAVMSPSILQQPENETLGLGCVSDFTVVAQSGEYGDGGVLTYQWYDASDDSALAGETGASLSTGIPGDYYVIVTNDNGSEPSDTVTLVIMTDQVTQDNQVEYRQWDGIAGGIEVTLVTEHPDYPDNPDSSYMLTTGLDPAVPDDNDYGALMTGFIVPPENADYTFKVCSDDTSELWLSTDADPANYRLIAQSTVWANHNNWGDGDNVVIEDNIALTGGKFYAFYAVFREDGGGQNFSVGWISNGTVIDAAWDGANSVVAAQYVSSVGPADWSPVNETPASGSIIDDTADVTIDWEQAPQGPCGGMYEVFVSKSPISASDCNDLAPTDTTATPSHTIPAADIDHEDIIYVRVAVTYDGRKQCGNLWSYDASAGDPVFTGQPADTTAVGGGNASFTVEVIADSLQWSGPAGPIGGATGATLNLTGVGAGDIGEYSCVATNTNGTTTSNSASLDVGLLIHHWPMDAIGGTEPNFFVEDVAGDLDGVPAGEPNGLGVKPGIIGNALDLSNEGKLGYIDIDDSIGTLSAFTVSVWLNYHTDIDNLDSIMHHDGWTTSYMHYHTRNDGRITNNVNGTGGDLYSLGRLGDGDDNTPGVWYHVVLTYDVAAGQRIYYINGSQDAVQNRSFIPAELFPGNIGAYNNDAGNRHWDGLMDDFRIYDYALSRAQVAALYHAVYPDAPICVDPPEGDLNGDCVVDIVDFAIWAASFGWCDLLPVSDCP